jgi:hypothetical protein
MERMNKVIPIVLAFLLSCATAKQPAISAKQPAKSPVPKQYQDKIISVVARAQGCVNPGKTIKIKIARSEELNAWADNESIGFTEAHVKLGHLSKAQGVSYATTGVMLIVNAFIPGAGYLNHVVNPAVVNNYNKSQEFEADKMASRVSASCLNVTIERQVIILRALKARTRDGGGFWDRHPSWDERIANIQNKD